MSIATINNEATMTLKEITDLLEVEHNKAMRIVSKMTESQGFGQVEKMATCIEIGNGAKRDIQTYRLNRRQSMAVSARLNTDLLMKVIDRLDELESSKQTALPQTYAEALRMLAVEVEEKSILATENENQRHSLENKDKLIIASNQASIKAGEILVREFSKSIDFIEVGQNKMYEWLKEQGYIMASKEPYQRYVKLGWFTWKPSKEEINGEYRYTLRITPRGKVSLTKRYWDYIERLEMDEAA